MSLAGRPSQRAHAEEALVAYAHAVYYVCRRLKRGDNSRPNARILDCERCGHKVIATPYVLAEKRALAHSHGKELVVMCDDCLTGGDHDRPLIGMLPTREETEQAERFNRG